MRVFVAGGTGVIGRRLVPQLVARGHEVTATTTSAGKLGLLAQLGAEGVVMDGLDAASVGEAVAAAQPDAIVNQMTGLSEAHAGKPNLRKAERFFATTNRLRSEGIDHLLAAAEATGVSHVVAQGHASMNGIRKGGWVKTEDDPLEVLEGTKAINHLEDVVVSAGGAVLRYGGFYGPGAHDDQVKLVRKRLIPLIGGGTGYVSWVHVDDAASATVLAMEQKAHGVFNIVDDEPAPVSEWLPYLAECVGAKPPRRLPAWLARLLAGEMAVGIMTEGRGFSNAKAKRELGWELRYPSWRQGFKEELAMTRGEEFEELRPLLFAIAYRILGSVAEAEDAVQETWLRYESSPTQPTSTKAFLSAVVTRVSIDVLRSARVRREEYVGPWFPEPLLTDPYQDPARSAELADSLSMAALLLLERLSPLERAVFVLRDVFGFGFPEIASAVGRSEAACRQLAVRARRHMDAGRPRFEADRREREELAARFFDALRDGDVDRLRELLAADVQMVGDGGGKGPALAKGVVGADNVARLLASVFPVLARVDATVEPREVNGQPGAILRDRDGKVAGTMALDVLGGRIQTIRSVVNPDKLGHMGPVADAWAVAREVKQARRVRD